MLSTIPILGRQITPNLILGDETTSATITLKGGGTDGGTLVLEGKITCQDIVVESGVLTTLEQANFTTDVLIGDELNVNGNTRLGNTATDITDINGAFTVNMAGDIKLYDNSATPILVFSVAGATGDTSVNALTVASTTSLGGNVTVAGDILPSVTSTYSLGNATYKWKAVLSDSVIGSSQIDGTLSETFTIDSDNTGGDLILKFGTTLNEQLKWNNTEGRFEFTDDLYLPLTLAVDGNITTDGNVQINTGKNLTIYDNSATPVKVFEVVGTTGDTTVGSLYAGETTITGNIAVTGTVDGVDIAGASISMFCVGTTETPNGTITNFHLTNGQKYLAGKIAVFTNGVRQMLTNQFTEDADRLGITFTSGNIPATGEVVFFDYIQDIQ